jgi:hypothetical protein
MLRICEQRFWQSFNDRSRLLRPGRQWFCDFLSCPCQLRQFELVTFTNILRHEGSQDIALCLWETRLLSPLNTGRLLVRIQFIGFRRYQMQLAILKLDRIVHLSIRSSETALRQYARYWQASCIRRQELTRNGCGGLFSLFLFLRIALVAIAR